MNATQRSAIEKHQLAIQNIMSELETIRDENQDAYDNMPEGLQSGEKGDAANEAVENLESACNSLQETIDSLDLATA